MDAYLLTLYAGFGGLLLMSVLGWSHAAFSHGSHAHHGGTSPRQHAAGHKAGLQPRGSRGDGLTSFLAHLISPVVIFSLLLGFGATGVLLRPFAAHWPIFLLPVVAAVDAGLFERYLVQPIWRLLFGFASAPAQTLESLVREEGRAVTNFDATGTGLIVVDLDGQVRQLLGRLVPGQRTAGGRVRSGDRLVICAVDPRRNSCTVTRL
jgi:hypothetical protein